MTYVRPAEQQECKGYRDRQKLRSQLLAVSNPGLPNFVIPQLDTTFSVRLLLKEMTAAYPRAWGGQQKKITHRLGA